MTPLPSIFTHSLYDLIHPEKASKLAVEHEGGEKCLHLYKLACSIKGKVKKCWHSHWVNENSRWGDGGGICEFKSDGGSFLFETHYTSSVASLSKCVPSYSMALSFKKPPPAKYLSNYFHSLCSDVMNTQ